jgi:hypothetical protein
MAKLIQFQVVTGNSQAGSNADNFTTGASIYALDDDGRMWFGKREQGGVKWTSIQVPSSAT